MSGQNKTKWYLEDKERKRDADYIIIQDKWQGIDLWENCNYNDN